MRVLHSFPIVDVGSSVVPVHDDEIHVLASQQLLNDVLQPCRRGASGPVPVDEEGGGPGGVEVGLVHQVGVGHEMAAGDIVSGVEQQPHVDLGSEERVAQIQVCELIAFLSCRRRDNETGQNVHLCGLQRAVATLCRHCRLTAKANFSTTWLNEKKCTLEKE